MLNLRSTDLATALYNELSEARNRLGKLEGRAVMAKSPDTRSVFH